MIKPRVHVVYEYGVDLRPYSSAFIRLLRPLTYPGIAEKFEVTFGLDYRSGGADIVMIDRLWRPDITLSLAEDLVGRIRKSGARFVYAIDDNLVDLESRELDLVSQGVKWPTEEQKRIIAFLLESADVVIVTTAPLRDALSKYNPDIWVIPNTLDDRLLIKKVSAFGKGSRHGSNGIVIGYMGTATHDDDLLMVAPAIESLVRYHPDVEFQIVGGIGNSRTLSLLRSRNIPLRVLSPIRYSTEYPLFFLWMQRFLDWDIAIAPLVDSPFSKCKSDIKFLDYAAIHTAAVCSRVDAYAATVEDQKTGLLVDDDSGSWLHAMRCLVDNAAFRRQLEKNAWEYVIQNRILAQGESVWIDFLLSVLHKLKSGGW